MTVLGVTVLGVAVLGVAQHLTSQVLINYPAVIDIRSMLPMCEINLRCKDGGRSSTVC